VANPLPVTGSTFTTLGHEAVVTIPAKANVLVTGTVVLGSSSSGGASTLGLDMCYQLTGAGLSGGGYFVEIRTVQNNASAHSLTRIFGPLAAGTYRFGLCYATPNSNWNANDYVTNTVLVFN
jgi:hypothetical protein